MDLTLIEELKARGLFFQCTNEEAIVELLSREKTYAYMGVDPTGESLHLGHIVPLLMLCHLGRYGHTPIILTGGGTARVGDPSGKTESRPIMTPEKLAFNINKLELQLRGIMAKFDINPIFINNADWLNNLQYIDFIRDIGKHFSVSRMLSFDTYKKRLETGLSFLEFNYQLLQAYDYLHLFNIHKCKIQVGGSDQWANIVAGCDLIRRIHQEEVYGYTVPIVTRSDGVKMGKTEQGAIFLDPNITSPYDFYQYLRNISDADVSKFLKQYTFIDLKEIQKYDNCQGAELNEAKELLAYTLTEFIHGKDVAEEMQIAAKAAFYGAGDRARIPTYSLGDNVQLPMPFIDLYVLCGMSASKSEARRLIEQGGAKINKGIGEGLVSEKIDSLEAMLSAEDFVDNEITICAGKKKHMRILKSE